MLRRRRKPVQDAELDITAFMNLMIVLVPVLLMSLVFSHITILDLKLPDFAAGGDSKQRNRQVELVIRDEALLVNYPQGTLLSRIEKTEQGKYDFAHLSQVLREIKRRLKEQGIEKRNIVILSEPQTDYQTIVAAMDTVRSFKAMVAASVVDAELFPDISFGDAPAKRPAPGAKR